MDIRLVPLQRWYISTINNSKDNNNIDNNNIDNNNNININNNDTVCTREICALFLTNFVSKIEKRIMQRMELLFSY